MGASGVRWVQRVRELARINKGLSALGGVERSNPLSMVSMRLGGGAVVVRDVTNPMLSGGRAAIAAAAVPSAVAEAPRA